MLGNIVREKLEKGNNYNKAIKRMTKKD